MTSFLMKTRQAMLQFIALMSLAKHEYAPKSRLRFTIWIYVYLVVFHYNVTFSMSLSLSLASHLFM